MHPRARTLAVAGGGGGGGGTPGRAGVCGDARQGLALRLLRLDSGPLEGLEGGFRGVTWSPLLPCRRPEVSFALCSAFLHSFTEEPGGCPLDMGICASSGHPPPPPVPLPGHTAVNRGLFSILRTYPWVLTTES